jgi:membrane protease YdiL (CAAX protease family)
MKTLVTGSNAASQKEDIMTTIKAFIKRHPLLTYFAVVFAISWSGVLVVVGPGLFLGTREVSFATEGPLAYLAFLAGPSVAGILLAGLVNGKAGLRDLRSRLFHWRVGARWYAVALLTAPLVMIAALLPFVLISPVFLPAILTTEDKASILVPALVVGLVVPIFEELGWTGFAIPELRKRRGILATGLIVGLLWGAWHYPLFAASARSSGAIPPVLYVVMLLFAWLPPYRVLMVWVHDRTRSLLVAMVMHVPIVVSQFVLRSSGMSGVAHFINLLLWDAALWIIAAVVVVVNGRLLSQQSLQRRVA